jgi:hypothetical protein
MNTRQRDAHLLDAAEEGIAFVYDWGRFWDRRLGLGISGSALL